MIFDLKVQIYNKLMKSLDRTLQTSMAAIQSVKGSKTNETKSSAGDKFETGRAMMQEEEDRNERQHLKTMSLKNFLLQIDINKQFKTVQTGSLVYTNQGNYFIAIGHGKVMINNEIYYAISIDSPIGQLLRGKGIGDKTIFQNKNIIINNIG